MCLDSKHWGFGLWRCHWGLYKLHGLVPDYISSRLITLFCWLSHMNWSTMKPVMLHLFHTPPDCGTAFPRQCFTEKWKLIFLKLLPPGILSSYFSFYLFKHLLYLCHLFAAQCIVSFCLKCVKHQFIITAMNPTSTVMEIKCINTSTVGYLSTISRYFYFTWVLSFSPLQFRGKYYIFYYIYLITLVTIILQRQINNTKYHQHINSDVFSCKDKTLLIPEEKITSYHEA